MCRIFCKEPQKSRHITPRAELGVMHKERNIELPDYRASMHWNYFNICRENIKSYEAVESQIQGYKSSGEEKHIIAMNIAAAYSRREKYVVVPIVFAAMCLEAFIYDYGASCLSGKYVRDHIDRLEVPSKFVVLTQLVTGKKFPTDSMAYEKLKTLVKDRNKLIHYKSKKFDSNDFEGIGKWHLKMNDWLKASMYNAHSAVIEVMKEFDKLHDYKTKYHEIYTTDAECHA
jgi:replicative superfamily II helicase